MYIDVAQPFIYMKTWHGEKLTTVQKNADYVSLYVLSSKLINVSFEHVFTKDYIILLSLLSIMNIGHGVIIVIIVITNITTIRVFMNSIFIMVVIFFMVSLLIVIMIVILVFNARTEIIIQKFRQINNIDNR